MVKMRRSLLAVGLLLVCSVVRAQNTSSVAGHVPADACLAIASGDVGATCEEFLQTRLGETLSGDAFVPLVEKLRRLQLAGPLHLRPAFGFDWDDLRQVHSAGGLFVFPVGEGRQAVAWVFEGTSNSDSGPLAVAARYFGEQGFTSETLKRGGAQLVVLHSPERPERQLQQSSPVLFASQDYYGAANSLAAAEALLAVGRVQSLAANTAWQQAGTDSATATPRPGDVTVVVRPMELWELVRRESERRAAAENRPEQEKSDQQQRDPLAASRQLGFDGVQAVAAHVTFPAESLADWRIRATLVAPRPYAKALRILVMPPGPMPELPAEIGAGLTSATFWRWDFPTAMKGFGNLFDEANEPGPDGVGLFEDMLDGLRDDPEGVQVDLRREVFAQLGPQIMNITDRGGPQTEEQPHGDRTLYVTQVRDMAGVTDALKRFYRGDDRVRHTRTGEYEVWTVPEGNSLFVEGESDSIVSVRSLALGEGRMLFATDVDLLQSVLDGRAAAPGLGDGAAWTGLWRKMKEQAAEASLWGLTRLDDTMAPAYAQATSEGERDEETGLMAGVWRILLFGTADRQVQVPTAEAPPFDRVRAALQPAGVVMMPAAEGWTITIDAARGEGAE